MVNSAHFTGLVTVRMQNYHNKNSSKKVIPTSSYFQNRRRFFSFQFQGRFKPTNRNREDNMWSYDDVLFCAETENKVTPPRGASLAVKFARFIDPGFTAEGMFAEKRPWAGSWVVCGMNVMRVSEAECTSNGVLPDDKSDEGFGEASDTDSVVSFETDKWNSRKQKLTPPLNPAGRWTSDLQEDTSLVLNGRNTPMTSAKRRSHFLDPATRQAHVFHPGHVYAFDFFNNFTNFTSMTAEMIVRFSITKVLRNQPLRFVCRNREGNVVFFVIEIDYSDLN